MSDEKPQSDGGGDVGKKPAITLALIESALTRPVIDGRVGIEGVALTALAVEPADLFFRQLRSADYDSSELSLSSLFIKHARGDRTWLALPVFTSRNFYHTLMLVRRGSGISSPADLRGKRVGVPEYQQTAAVWARGVLSDDFGIFPWDIEWHMERLPSFSHAHSTGSVAPANVTVHAIPADSSIMQMLAEGALDATLFYFGPTTLDRSVMNDAAAAAVQPMFLDRGAEGVRFFKSRGYVPMNHGMVLRRSLAEAHPWLPGAIVSAMQAAKEQAHRDAQAYLAPYISSGLVPGAVASVFQRELMPYGLKANLEGLETIARYVHQQGLTDHKVSIEELFAPCD